MSENRYGLDISYFYNLFARELTDLNDHTPSELARALVRASVTADKYVVLEDEFSGHLRNRIEKLEKSFTDLLDELQEVQEEDGSGLLCKLLRGYGRY